MRSLESIGPSVTRSEDKGSVSELVVETFFQRNGHIAFRPGTHHTPVDMAVRTREGGYIGVQVKTLRWTNYDNHKTLRTNVRKGGSKVKLYDLSDFDWLACVYEEAIWLIPHSEVFGQQTVIVHSTSPRANNKGRFDHRRVQ